MHIRKVIAIAAITLASLFAGSAIAASAVQAAPSGPSMVYHQ